VKQKVAPPPKKLRTQINGKCNDITSTDKNKQQNIIIELYLKRQYSIYSFKEDSVVLIF
jgi:hypothetical protein